MVVWSVRLAQSTKFKPQPHRRVKRTRQFCSTNLCVELSEFSQLPFSLESEPSPSPERGHTQPQALLKDSCLKAATFPLFLVQGMVVNFSPNPRCRVCMTCQVASHCGNALLITCCLRPRCHMTNCPFTGACRRATVSLPCGESLLLLISFLLAHPLHVQVCCLCTAFIN